MHDRRDKGFVIWFTGLSGSGASTLARALARALDARGRRVEVLDGDEVRARLVPDLGGSKAERDAKVARVAYVARLLAHHGAVVVAAVTSPYRDARDQARREIGRFVEVHVDCPLETCVARDATGLYRRALAGDLPNVPGISDPYEPPRSPEIVVPSGAETPEASVQRILRKLVDLGYLRPVPPSSTSDHHVPVPEARAEPGALEMSAVAAGRRAAR
jgi:adenylyl-sulfate kinase